MKWAVLVCSSAALLLTYGCRKNQPVFQRSNTSLLDSSKAFFESVVLPAYAILQVKKDSTERSHVEPTKWMKISPLWEKASLVRFLNKDAVLVDLKYEKPYLIKSNLSAKNLYSVEDVNRLLIYRDAKNTFHAEKLTLFPDSNYNNLPGKKFSGIIVVQNWNGELLNRYKYENGGKIRKYVPGQTAKLGIGNKTLNYHSTKLAIVQDCYESSGYNYLEDDPENGYYWLQDLGCDTYYVDDGAGGGGDIGGESTAGDDYGSTGGGGGGGVSPSPTVTMINGNDPITNVREYIKCFTNIPGGSNAYSITLCVAQPEVGSREPWGFSGSGTFNSADPVSVGHTFLIFNETTTLGSTIRNVGFYPKSGANPYTPSSAGQLNNDANHDYNIALTIKMNSSEFTEVLNFIQQGNDADYLYNLNTNNCTTFAINALGAAGFNIPRTNGSWLNGSGMNPGDLGEDIRNMQLPSNMTITNLTGSHPNVGFCY